MAVYVRIFFTNGMEELKVFQNRNELIWYIFAEGDHVSGFEDIGEEEYFKLS